MTLQLSSTMSRLRKARGQSARRTRCNRRLILEPLESRTLPTVSFVPGGYELPQTGSENTPGLFTGSPIEPLVAINPTDPANVVISSQNGLQVSTNASGTFSTPTTFPLVTGASGDNGDTAMAFDSQGRLFWANLESISAGGRDVVVTQVNPTSGALVGSPVRVPNPNTRGSDKEFLAADTNPNSPNHDNLYVSFDLYNSTTDEFEVFVSRSTDQGQTWSTPLQLSVNSGPNSEGFTWPSSVSVAPNGDVYVAYHAQPDLTDSDVEAGERDNAAVFPLTTTGKGKNPDGTQGQEIVFRSTDGGRTFSQRAVPFDAGQADITFNKQDATNGRTIPGTTFWTMGSTQPWVLADPARPGNVYVIAADDPFNGAGGSTDPSNVLVTRSMDSGVTWSSPQDIDVGTTVPGTSSNSFQLFPTAAIDQSGNIVVAWYDNRQGLTNSSGDYLLDVYARYSTDGALTWSNPFQLNSTHFDPDPGAVNRFTGPPATTRIGEYFGIAMSNGLAYVDWNGNTFDAHGAAVGQQVYLRNFQINGSLMLTQPADVLQHNLTIDQLPGAPNNNFLEILDRSGTPLSTQRVYVGMGDYLRGISILDDSNAGNLYDIEKTFFGDNVDIHFAGRGGQVGISDVAQNLDNIAGNVNIFSGFGFGSGLTVLDANDPFAGDAWTITRSTIQRFGAGLINYDGMDGLGIRGGDLGATYDVFSTEGATMTSLVGGVSGDVFNVRSTSGPLRIDGTDSTNGLLDTVNVGSLAPALGGTTAGITGTLTIGSSMNKINIDLDDSGDATGQTVTVTNSAVTGLAPAEIDYTASQVNDLIILGGNGADTFTLASAPAFLGISGGGGTNTLVGPNTSNTWEVTGPGAGTVDGVSFTHMGILRGGNAPNTFQFGPMGSVPVLLDGGGGSSNTLDYSTDGGVGGAVNLQTGAASRINGGAAGSFKRIQRLIGSTGAGDLVIGPDANSTWFITGNNAGTIGGVTFAGFKNLRGGSQNDVFRFRPGSSLSGVVDGGGGSNALDYSFDGAVAATVNLQTHAATLVHGGAPGGFVHIQAVVGSTATSDRLIGLNVPTLWQITGSNAGMAGGVAFAGIKNVQGGTASDIFRFTPNGSLSGGLAGGGGGDWLDYSLFTTPVAVNLLTASASRVGSAATGKVSQIQNVVGGNGNDALVGNALGNILIGGSATNVVTGGSGRSILIGGAGTSTIKGGPADDILIAGTTSFDANHAALMSILAEWQRTDKTYAQRIADLRNGGGLNGTTKLIWGATVQDDDGSDTLTGGPGLDWFFANLGPGGVVDHITDRNNGGPEQVN
jgi:Peptidase M10 serralysin C terminal